jgi:tetratricopeptide (TPR) repeat protein
MVATEFFPFSLISKQYQRIAQFYQHNRKRLIIVIVTVSLALIIYKPQKFIDLWLTSDQQGQILFNLDDFDGAATKFSNTRWQAYSFYGAEKFEQSVLLYSQFDSAEDTLARANALAQQRRYIRARNLYQEISEQYPDFVAAKTNLKIVQEIIDAVNLMSESQKAEDGDAPKELGDEPQTGDGADKQEMRKQEVENYSAEQLLLDPELNAMWLRQVQKNPARFLAQKFNMQLKVTALPVKDKASNSND